MTLGIVFDSAGTLMKTMRAVIEKNTKAISTNGVETTLLIFEDNARILALLDADKNKILSCKEKISISQWIKENSITYKVTCMGSNAKEELIDTIIKSETEIGNGEEFNVSDLQKIILACANDADKESQSFMANDFPAINTGLIINTRQMAIEYLVATAGYPFAGVEALSTKLQDVGATLYIASGDSTEKLKRIAHFIKIPETNVFGAATPERKERVVKSLQEKYDTVVMVGDGINDLAAMRAADVSILTLQQRGRRPDILFSAADVVIHDIREVEKIVSPYL